jgi:hypothetical protein
MEAYSLSMIWFTARRRDGHDGERNLPSEVPSACRYRTRWPVSFKILGKAGKLIPIELIIQ